VRCARAQLIRVSSRRRLSGLLGLCGDSDMRAIQQRAAAGDEDASIALGVFVKRIRKYLGSFLVELGGHVDAIVFTAGIGENSAQASLERRLKHPPRVFHGGNCGE
jgi:acetate kinase